jgi:hypothetical protein
MGQKIWWLRKGERAGRYEWSWMPMLVKARSPSKTMTSPGLARLPQADPRIQNSKSTSTPNSAPLRETSRFRQLDKFCQRYLPRLIRRCCCKSRIDCTRWRNLSLAMLIRLWVDHNQHIAQPFSQCKTIFGFLPVGSIPSSTGYYSLYCT